LLLIALILRGVAFEFRSKNEDPRWRSLWDWAIFVGSALAALLLGVAFANLAKGVPIDSNMNYAGTFWTLLNPYGLLGGLMTIATFLLHGAIFLNLKTTDELSKRAYSFARRIWLLVVILTVLMLIATYFYTDILARLGVDPGLIPIAGIVTLLLAGYFLNRKMNGWAFAMTGLTIVLTVTTAFLIMFPRLMISTLNPAYSLTIYNAASSSYTLRVMSIVALIFVPIVLAYQAWTYWTFRKRISAEPEKLTY
jgi:cytochrome d ubiquinol oxidase subunit II